MDPGLTWKQICSKGAVMNNPEGTKQINSCPSHDIELGKID